MKGGVNAGIVPRLEGKVEVPLVVLEPDGLRADAGLGDAVVGVKYRFIGEEDVTADGNLDLWTLAPRPSIASLRRSHSSAKRSAF